MTYLPLCQHKDTRFDGVGHTACLDCGARFLLVRGGKPPASYNRRWRRRER